MLHLIIFSIFSPLFAAYFSPLYQPVQHTPNTATDAEGVFYQHPTPIELESFCSAFNHTINQYDHPDFFVYKARLPFKPLAFLMNINPVLNIEARDFFPPDIDKIIFQKMTLSSLVNCSLTCKTFAKMIRTEEFARKVTTLRDTDEIAQETDIHIQPWMVPTITKAIAPWRFRALNPAAPENSPEFAIRCMIRIASRVRYLPAFKGFFGLYMAPFPEAMLPPFIAECLWSGNNIIGNGVFWIPEDSSNDLLSRLSLTELGGIASHTVFNHIFTPVLFAQYLIPAWAGARKLTIQEMEAIKILTTEVEIESHRYMKPGAFGLRFFAEILHNITFLTVGGLRSTAREYKRFHKFFSTMGIDSKLLVEGLPRTGNSYDPWNYGIKTVHAFAKMLSMDLKIVELDPFDSYNGLAVVDPTLLKDELPSEVTPWTVFKALNQEPGFLFRCNVVNARIVPRHCYMEPNDPRKLRKRNELTETLTQAPPQKRQRTASNTVPLP